MIDLVNENTLRLNDARELAWLKGRTGKRISKDSLQRWSLRGLRGVRLETVRMGGTTYTSTEAILRFFNKLNGEQDIPSQISQGQTAADKRLDEARIA